MFSRLRKIGPGAFVVAAFIGPGTVTTCTLAGANFGFGLLWAIVFATIATIILQEMAARLGVVTQQGLGESLRSIFSDSPAKWPLFLLITLALYMGNAAYEAGNLSGAALGLQAVFASGASVFRWFIVGISAAAGILLWQGAYRHIERILLALVALMALSFISTFAIVRPDIVALFRGMVLPVIPGGALTTVIALIGTTVVPYNLFLHAAAVREKWQGEADLADARADTAISIGLGGIIAILIVSTAAASFFGSGLQITGAGDMATQFEPLFGRFSRYLLGLGFLAAGLSSAITAPLATAHVMTELLGSKGGTSSTLFKAVALSVIVVGAILSLTGVRPLTIIVSAQFANGLLLPIVATFLLYAMNQERILGTHVNSTRANVLGIGVVLVTAGLGTWSILRATGVV
ncbi:MAG: Nramp family divalent metal transporter [Gammaproteobacteria bacterium]|nr:Nramp family divalent metal transporter [Gammaproteobacteria bacterium]